jgi:hypothetical protein
MSAFPRSHVDLLDGPLPAVLTTEMPNGRFQSTVVWFNRRRRSHPLLDGPLGLNAGMCCRRGPMEIDSLRSRLIPERLKEREATVHTSSR